MTDDQVYQIIRKRLDAFLVTEDDDPELGWSDPSLDAITKEVGQILRDVFAAIREEPSNG